MRRFACIALLICVCLLLCACGTDTEVPESVIRDTVNDYIRAEGLSGISKNNVKITATHDPDSSNHTDTVKIKAELEYPYGAYVVSSTQTYQYEQTNDLWRLYRRGEWSNPTYQFNDKLIGSWHIDCFDDDYDIDIQDVDGQKIKMKCTAKVEVQSGFGEYTFCTLSESGTFVLNERWLDIELELPDGYGWAQNFIEDRKNSAELTLELDLESGVVDGFIYGTIYG